jgi:hypothetical protein
MDYFQIALLFLHLYLELNIFPSYLETLLNPTTVLFMILVLASLYLAQNLRKYGILPLILVTSIDMLIGLPLINNYYDKNIIPIQQTHFFFIYSVIIFGFLFSDAKDFKQLKESYAVQTFIGFIFRILITYSFFYHFNSFHTNDINILSSFDNKTMAKLSNDFLIDFAIFFNCLVSVNIIKLLISKKGKKKKYIYNIFKKIFSLFIITSVYYLINNHTIAVNLYELINNYVPLPYNIILYNILPADPAQKTRVFFALTLWILN